MLVQMLCCSLNESLWTALENLLILEKAKQMLQDENLSVDVAFDLMDVTDINIKEIATFFKTIALQTSFDLCCKNCNHDFLDIAETLERVEQDN